MKRLKLTEADVYIDGASRGNPGPSAIGVVFQNSGGDVVKTLSIRIGHATNNTAEYYALIFALQEALILGIRSLNVYTDSELLARQFSGEYKVKDPGLQALFLFVSHLKTAFKRLAVTHIPRERNKLADLEANLALDQTNLF